MEQFKVTIELGNDAMRHGYDVAKILREVARQMQSLELSRDYSKTIMDDNGNSVGTWEVS